jgi:hypothetical protein
VSRFSLEVTVDDVEKPLEEQLNLRSWFAPDFHVSVFEGGVWPAGHSFSQRY